MTLRSKLTLMFFGALQVTFFTAVGAFWAVQSWQLLTDDLALVQAQNLRLESALEGGAAGTEPVAPQNTQAFRDLRANIQNAQERGLVDALGEAFTKPDSSAVRDAVASGKLKGKKSVNARVTLTIAGLDIKHEIADDVAFE